MCACVIVVCLGLYVCIRACARASVSNDVFVSPFWSNALCGRWLSSGVTFYSALGVIAWDVVGGTGVCLNVSRYVQNSIQPFGATVAWLLDNRLSCNTCIDTKTSIGSPDEINHK